MPIYEYKCGKCKKVFEELVQGTEEKKPKCPACGKDDTKKILSNFGVAGVSAGNTCTTSCSGGSCSTCG